MADEDERFLHELMAYLEPLAAPQEISSAPLASAHLLTGPQDNEQRLMDALYSQLEHDPFFGAQSSSQASSPSSSSGSNSNSMKKDTNAPKGTVVSRNSTREKMQSELRTLRAHHASLEHSLKELQRQKQQQQPSQSQLLLLTTWEHITQHQLEQRKRAELENVQLKQKVASNLAVARAFQKPIWDWMIENENVSAFLPENNQIAFSKLASANMRDIKIYEMLASQVDDAALRLDDVFRENGLSRWQLGSAPSQTQMKYRAPTTTDDDFEATDSHDSAMYIEFLNADVLPFPKDVVFNASWQNWEHRSLAKNNAVYANLPHHPKDTFACNLDCEIYLGGGGHISIGFQCVTKAFMYHDRIVYVWRGVSKSDTQFPGAYVYETGWQVVRALDDTDGAGVLEDGSLVLTCTQLEPSCDQALDELQARNVTPLANLVVSATKIDIREVSDRLVSLLLRDSPSPVVSM